MLKVKATNGLDPNPFIFAEKEIGIDVCDRYGTKYTRIVIYANNDGNLCNVQVIHEDASKYAVDVNTFSQPIRIYGNGLALKDREFTRFVTEVQLTGEGLGPTSD